MSENTKNIYDDGNIPDIDLPQNGISTIPDGAYEAGRTDNSLTNCHRKGSDKNKPPQKGSVEPLPESTRPRQDGPGGN